MKKLLLTLLLAAASSVQAEAISLETDGNPKFRPASAEIRRAVGVREGDETCAGLAALPLALSNAAGAEYFAVAGCQGGSAAAPLWIVKQQGNRVRVLLAGGGYTLNPLPQRHHGLRDLAVGAGNAGQCRETVYRFDGRRYCQHTQRNCLK